MTYACSIHKTSDNHDEYHSCVNDKTDFLRSYRKYNNPWVSIEDGVKCGLIKFAVQGADVDRKPYPELYRFIRSKGTVMITMGRILEYQRHCDRPTNWYSLEHAFKSKWILDITEEETYDLKEDPQHKFTPSQSLIEKVNKSLVPLDKYTFEMLENLKSLHDNKIDERIVLSDIISDEIEDLFTNLARRLFISKKQIQILENKSFTHDICMDLIDRLGLHVQFSIPVLELLHDELIIFLSSIDRKRNWGKITIENSDIKLILKEDAFSR